MPQWHQSCRAVVTEPVPADAIQQLCVACVDLLDVTGAGVSVMTDAGGGGIVGASGDLAARVEEWQFSLGEGPCKEAYSAGQPVMVGDVAMDDSGQVAQWPMFGDVIVGAGIMAIFAFPMRLNGLSVGVLDIFRDRVGPLSSEQMGVATAFADLAGALLKVDAQTVVDGDFETEPVYRFEVHQATGMVAAQLDVTAQEALVRLRARAFAEGRTVSELASDVVARRIRFDKEDL